MNRIEQPTFYFSYLSLDKLKKIPIKKLKGKETPSYDTHLLATRQSNDKQTRAQAYFDVRVKVGCSYARA